MGRPVEGVEPVEPEELREIPQIRIALLVVRDEFSVGSHEYRLLDSVIKDDRIAVDMYIGDPKGKSKVVGSPEIPDEDLFGENPHSVVNRINAKLWIYCTQTPYFANTRRAIYFRISNPSSESNPADLTADLHWRTLTPLQAYLELLRKNEARIAILDRTPVTLSDIFIPPETVLVRPPDRSIDPISPTLDSPEANESPKTDRVTTSNDNRQIKEPFSKQNPPRETETSFDQFITANEGQDIAILGEPGIGKSVVLRYLAGVIPNTTPPPLTGVPILIDLHIYLTINKADLDDYIEKRYGMHATFLNSQIKAGNACFLLDGYDEAFGLQDNALTTLIQGKCKGNQVILVSRPGAFHAHSFPQRIFKICTLPKFDDTQVRGFIDKWFTTNAKREQANRYFDDNPQTADLATNPLFLTLLCNLIAPDEDTWELPRRIGPLYDEFLLILYERLNEEIKDFPTRSTIPWPSKQAFLARLAYDTFVTRQYPVSQHHLDSMIISWDGFSNAEKTRARKEISIHNGILIDRGDKTYEFIHQTFQEFLAACYLKEGSRWIEGDQLTEQRILSPRWRNVIRFLCSIPYNCTPIINRIWNEEIEQNERDTSGQYRLLLAAHCIAECQYISPAMLQLCGDAILATHDICGHTPNVETAYSELCRYDPSLVDQLVPHSLGPPSDWKRNFYVHNLLLAISTPAAISRVGQLLRECDMLREWFLEMGSRDPNLPAVFPIVYEFFAPLLDATDTPKGKKRQILTALSGKQSERAISIFTKALEDPELQDLAIGFLHEHRDALANLQLKFTQLLADTQNPVVRHQVIRAFGDIGKEELVNLLLPYLKDNDLRDIAFASLLEIGATSYLPALVDYVVSGSASRIRIFQLAECVHRDTLKPMVLQAITRRPDSMTLLLLGGLMRIAEALPLLLKKLAISQDKKDIVMIVSSLQHMGSGLAFEGLLAKASALRTEEPFFRMIVYALLELELGTSDDSNKFPVSDFARQSKTRIARIIGLVEKSINDILDRGIPPDDESSRRTLTLLAAYRHPLIEKYLETLTSVSDSGIRQTARRCLSRIRSDIVPHHVRIMYKKRLPYWDMIMTGYNCEPYGMDFQSEVLDVILDRTPFRLPRQMAVHELTSLCGEDGWVILLRAARQLIEEFSGKAMTLSDSPSPKEALEFIRSDGWMQAIANGVFPENVHNWLTREIRERLGMVTLQCGDVIEVE